MKIREVMSSPVATILGSKTVQDAVEIMAEKQIGSLVVLAQGKPVGVISERDLLSKVVGLGKNASKVLVADVATKPIVTIDPDAELKDAARRMIFKKSRLVVVEGDEVVGMVTASDLARGIAQLSGELIPLSKSMTKRVYCLSGTSTVDEAVRIMNAKRVGSVIVTKRGQPQGIFTERDLIGKVLSKNVPLDRELGQFASSPLKSIDSGASVRDAARVMVSSKIKRLPVMDDTQVMGIVTARDLVEAVASQG